MKRSGTLTGGSGGKRKEIRRSARIQSRLPSHEVNTKQHTKLGCVACDLTIGNKIGDRKVVKCLKCENMFHTECTGIQEEWLGYFKFQCSKMEIECRKRTKANKRRKEVSDDTDCVMTDIVHSNRKYKSCGSDLNFTNHSPERPQSPTSNENSGLTQELENLTILDKKANTPSSSNTRVHPPYRDRNSWNPTTG